MRLKRFQDVSLNRKLTLLAMGTTIAALAAVSILLFVAEIATFRSRMTKNLTTVAIFVGSNSSAALLFHDRESGERVLSSLAWVESIVVCAVYSADGKPFAVYWRSRALEEPLRPHFGREGAYFEGGYFHLIQPIEFQGETIGRVYLWADLETLYSALWHYGLMILGALSTATLLAFWMAKRLQKVISEPILSLVSVAHDVAARNDYSLRARRAGNDEIGTLVDEFNEMLSQAQIRDGELKTYRENLESQVKSRTSELEKANRGLQREMAQREEMETQLVQAGKMAALGQLAGGVAHEVNNPLTVVKFNLEVIGEQVTALQGVCKPRNDGPDIERAHRSLNTVTGLIREAETAVRRITGLIVSFSRLADVGHGEAPAGIDVNAELRNFLTAHPKSSRGRRVKFEFSDREACTAGITAGDFHGSISDIVSYFTTASSAAGEEGEDLLVRIEAGRYEGRSSVVITSDGPKLHPEDLATIFDPRLTPDSEDGKTMRLNIGLARANRLLKSNEGGLIVSLGENGAPVFRILLSTPEV
jgi:signal transduction histidine kinase